MTDCKKYLSLRDMNSRIRHIFNIRILVCAVAVAAFFASCKKEEPPYEPWLNDPDSFRRVVIMYAAAHNDLYDEIIEDFRDLSKSSLPKLEGNKDALICIGNFMTSRYNKIDDDRLHMVRVRNRNGEVMLDTLHSWPEGTISASAETMEEALSMAKDKLPAEEYNLIFSSHATGYLPPKYYGSYNDIERKHSEAEEVIYRSIGHDKRGTEVYEMGLPEFAEALPMHFNSIIFDCCLMGCIEVAYELRNKCDYIVFSPTEILSFGMDYVSMGRRLFAPKTDLRGLCQDYYEMYDRYSGDSKSASISLIDCSELYHLSNYCHDLFRTYSDKIQEIRPDEVQRYWTTGSGYPFPGFYDFRDILKAAGCSETELARLDVYLSDCVAYKLSTASFLPGSGGFAFNSFCGLSMYLPVHRSHHYMHTHPDNSYLEEYYRTLAWNKATGLVR